MQFDFSKMSTKDVAQVAFFIGANWMERITTIRGIIRVSIEICPTLEGVEIEDLFDDWNVLPGKQGLVLFIVDSFLVSYLNEFDMNEAKIIDSPWFRLDTQEEQIPEAKIEDVEYVELDDQWEDSIKDALENE